MSLPVQFGMALVAFREVCPYPEVRVTHSSYASFTKCMAAEFMQ